MEKTLKARPRCGQRPREAGLRRGRPAGQGARRLSAPAGRALRRRAAMGRPSASWSTGARPPTCRPTPTCPNRLPSMVTVNPGPVFLFDKASIINQAPPPVRRDDAVPLPADEGFASAGGALRRHPAGREAVGRGLAPAGPPEGAGGETAASTADHDTDRVDATHRHRSRTAALLTARSRSRAPSAWTRQFVAWMTGLQPGRGIRSRRPRARQQAAVAARRLPRAAYPGGDEVGPDGRLPIAVVVQERQLHRFGIGGSYSRRSTAPASRPTGCTATCSAAPSGCASTPRSPGSAATTSVDRAS